MTNVKNDINIKLGKGWSYRFEVGDPNMPGNDDHMHLFKTNKSQEYSQNSGGSPKDGPKGGSGPTKKAKKLLKEKTGWDWEAKEQEWLNKVEVTIDESGVFLIKYPSGEEIHYNSLVPYLEPNQHQIMDFYINNSIDVQVNSETMFFPMPQPIVVPQLLPTPIWIPAF